VAPLAGPRGRAGAYGEGAAVRAGVSVADVMRDQVVAVRERARFAEIVAAMRRFHISSLPVVDSEDRVIGLISNYDLLLGDVTYGFGAAVRFRWFGRRAVRGGVSGRVAVELMSVPPVTVTAATPAREAAREMYRCRIHQLPVVDALTGRLTGIVTRSDLLAVYERPDEEIRCEILYGIIQQTLGMSVDGFDVSVVGGAVTIRGRLERRSDAVRLGGAVVHVAGVSTLVDHLKYQVDDSASSLMSRRP
jgi:CBS domain-containing protein